MRPRALVLLAALGLSAPIASAAQKNVVVAVQAGTIHLVDGGRILEGGTILVQGGRILAVGEDVVIPAGARIVDYGADAVIAPGFVAAESEFASFQAAPRTAEPSLMAVDAFDPYTPYWSALTAGVTTAYLAPARNRLIAGQGAVVKSHGPSDRRRVVKESAALHGSISRDARVTPGYWEPPVPATVDVGMGMAQRQLPRTTMGAIIALEELLALSRGEGGENEYGPYAGPGLVRMVNDEVPWRMGANSAEEIRALLEFFGKHGLPLILDGARDAGEMADEIAAAGVPVIIDAPIAVNTRGRDLGKTPDSEWPTFDAASKLAAAGVKIAIATPDFVSLAELRFAAAVSMRGGLSKADALRAITLGPAEILGVADRVGSIAPGKDADFVVFGGHPLEATSAIVSTWSGGDVAWKAAEGSAVVVEVDELFIGDGTVLTPGQVLVHDGRIAEVGSRVTHPAGATVVRGPAAMPGMVDALGHLGLEGSRKAFSPRFDLRRIVEPGDYADRRVAQGGVTTVNLTSRAAPGSGSPTMAYKPAGDDIERMVIAAPNALVMQWDANIKATSGSAVKKQLEKAQQYKLKWEEYEKQIAAWVPPAPEDPEDKGDEEDEEAEGEDKKKDDEGADKKKKKKKKKKDEEEPARPITGVWEGELAFPDGAESKRIRLRVLDTEGSLEGNLRCDNLSAELIDIRGTREEKAVRIAGRGSEGLVELEIDLAGKKLTGKVRRGGNEADLEVEQTSTEYVVAGRTERRREKKPAAPKGKPKPPKITPDLEVLRQAMLGNAAVIVTVAREDQILACVLEFEKYGIKPVLSGANEASKVASKLRGRVAGVLLSQVVTQPDPKIATKTTNRYAELASAGIPVAFHSGAEEGAVDLGLKAAHAIAHGMSPIAALRALTADAAEMLAIDNRVGRLAPGLDADILLLDGSPFEISTSVLRVWVDGKEIR